MKLLIEECQDILNILESLEKEALIEARDDPESDKKAELKVDPRLFYAIGRIRNKIVKRIFSPDVGYLTIFKGYITFHNQIRDLKAKYTKEVKLKTKTKTTFDEKAFEEEGNKLREENKEMLKSYTEFQKKEIEFNGEFHKINVNYLPKKLSTSIVKALVDYELVME